MIDSHIFFDRQFQKSTERVLPGDFAASKLAIHQGLLMTVLGSCVSVCLRDVVNSVAGMNHFMLPEAGLTTRVPSALEEYEPSLNARYGAQAMELLINKMLSLGATRSNLQAYVFGGAKVLTGTAEIGIENVKFALDYLKRERIQLLNSDVGGNLPRKVYIDLETGLPGSLTLPRTNAGAMSHITSDVTAMESLCADSLLASVKLNRNHINLFH
jgi:chemotaxis protein CheD